MAETKNYEQKPRAMRPMRGGRGMPVPKGAIKKGTLKRLLKGVFKYYKWQAVLALVCMAFNSVGGLVSSVYMQQLVDKVIDSLSCLHHQKHLAWLSQTVSEFFEAVTSDDIFILSSAFGEFVDLRDCSVIYRYGESLGFHVHHEVLTHHGKTDKPYICFIHYFFSLYCYL